MDKTTLKTVGEWARTRVESGEEPPWTYNKLKMLAELATEFAEAMDSNVAYAPGLDFVGENVPPNADNVVFLKTEGPDLNDPDIPLPA